MKLKPHDLEAVQLFFHSIMQSLGFVHIMDMKQLAAGQYCIAAMAQGPKHLKVFVATKTIAESLVASCKERELDVVVDQKKITPGMFEIALSQLFIVYKKNPMYAQAAPSKRDEAVVKNDTAGKTVVVKNDQQAIIERLFDLHKIKTKQIELLSESGELLHIVFNSKADCQKAGSVLLENGVEFAEEDAYMYISLALSDDLLNGLIEHENATEKKQRHIGEHGQRLNFFLIYKLGLKIKAPLDNATTSNTECVVLSGEGKYRRINFCSPDQCNKIKQKLEEVGFSCNHAAGSAIALIIDLEKTTMKTPPTLYPVVEIKRLLKKEGLVYTSEAEMLSSKHKNTPEDVHLIILQDEDTAQKACELIKELIPDTSVSKRSLKIPKRCLQFRPRKGGRIAKNLEAAGESKRLLKTKKAAKAEKKVTSSKAVTADKKDKVVKDLQAHSGTELAEKLIAVVRAETLSSLNNKAAQIVEENYLIPKAGGEFLEFPVSAFQVDILFDGKTIKVRKALFSKKV